MLLKTWRIDPSNFYIRRRDQELVQVVSHASFNVKYILKRTGVSFNVSTNGFRRGFRPADKSEIPHEMAAATGAASANE